jgi:uncharacterized protein (DUF488 family)
VTVFTLGHGTRPLDELVRTLLEADVRTLVDVRRYPGSRRNPQFNRAGLAAALEREHIAYAHAVELGGLLAGEPGQERFACISTEAFRSYLARMTTARWQAALDEALGLEAPCLMCAELLPWRCHRRLVADLLQARGHHVVHLIRPGESMRHRAGSHAEVRAARLYVCGELVA